MRAPPRVGAARHAPTAPRVERRRESVGGLDVRFDRRRLTGTRRAAAATLFPPISFPPLETPFPGSHSLTAPRGRGVIPPFKRNAPKGENRGGHQRGGLDGAAGGMEPLFLHAFCAGRAPPPYGLPPPLRRFAPLAPTAPAGPGALVGRLGGSRARHVAALRGTAPRRAVCENKARSTCRRTSSRPALRTSSVLEALEPSPFSRPPRCRCRVNRVAALIPQPSRHLEDSASRWLLLAMGSSDRWARTGGPTTPKRYVGRDPYGRFAFRSRKGVGLQKAKVLLFLARTPENGRAG